MNLMTIATPWMWGGFILFVLLALAIDLFALGGKNSQKVTTKQAVSWSLAWFTLAFLFAGLLWWHLNRTVGVELANEQATAFLTGYLIEKALSIDNIFVFLMVFGYFSVPVEYQRRVLLYGVLGAIVMRAVMIFAGSVLISQFHWVLYIFGAFLLITGAKMLLFADHEADLDKNFLLRWLRSHLRVTDDFHGEKFSIMKNGVRWFTPLALVVVMIEVTDLIFAVDSIPAIFAITTDPFIVFTSNIFAIMGLRALYFLLADMNERFHLLKYGLAFVLIFVGIKMLMMDFYKIPTNWSLGAVGLILGSSIGLSLMSSRQKH